MADEITNYLTLNGPAGSLTKFREKAVGPMPIYKLSDNKKHQQDKWVRSIPVLKMMRAERIKSGETFQFHNFIPIPKNVLEAGYDEIGRDWEYENWGVAGGAIYPKILDDETDSSKLVYRFQTLWEPPLRFIEVVSIQFPDNLFMCEFFQREQPYLPARIIEYNNGQLIADRPGSPIVVEDSDETFHGYKMSYIWLQRDHTS